MRKIVICFDTKYIFISNYFIRLLKIYTGLNERHTWLDLFKPYSDLAYSTELCTQRDEMVT